MNQLTLRQIPEPVEKKLRIMAQESGQSINKTVIGLLEKAFGLGSGGNKTKKHRDVKSVLRKWTDDEYREFQGNVKIFDSIDKEIWFK
jgi:hypothetical protein